MTKADRLKLCGRMLVVATALALFSSIQLEITGSRGFAWVWLHVVVGCCFFANVAWHLQLHFNWKSWVRRLRKQRSAMTRWLAILASLTLVRAVAALFHWVGSYQHSLLGAVHGKIGFVLLIVAAGHTMKRIKFFINKKASLGSRRQFKAS